MARTPNAPPQPRSYGWSSQQDDLLRATWGRAKQADICVAVGKRPRTVIDRARRLGLPALPPGGGRWAQRRKWRDARTKARVWWRKQAALRRRQARLEAARTLDPCDRVTTANVNDLARIAARPLFRPYYPGQFSYEDLVSECLLYIWQWMLGGYCGVAVRDARSHAMKWMKHRSAEVSRVRGAVAGVVAVLIREQAGRSGRRLDACRLPLTQVQVAA